MAFNSLSRDHVVATRDHNIIIENIIIECLTFNSLSRDHLSARGARAGSAYLILSTPSLGITPKEEGITAMKAIDAFNSLSRDHVLLCEECTRIRMIDFQLPLSGSLTNIE